jgi:hypothetical protein
MCDHEEFYELDRAAHAGYRGNVAELAAFASRCRARLCDKLLLIAPGANRGAG